MMYGDFSSLVTEASSRRLLFRRAGREVKSKVVENFVVFIVCGTRDILLGNGQKAKV